MCILYIKFQWYLEEISFTTSFKGNTILFFLQFWFEIGSLWKKWFKKVNTLTVSRSILLGIILAEPITTSAKFWGFTKVRGTLVTIRMDYNLRTIYIQFRMTQRRTCKMIVLNEIKNKTNHAFKKIIKGKKDSYYILQENTIYYRISRIFMASLD